MKNSENFEEFFDSWNYDLFEDFLKRDTYAYAKLIELLGEPGKELPIDPEAMTEEQHELCYELALSQTEWWDKFRQAEYENYQSRYE